MPPGNAYPDCMCRLVTSERYLFVLEDNYDGTYTEHFFIPMDKILNMAFLVSPQSEGRQYMSGSRPATGNAAVILSVLSVFSNVLVLPGNGGRAAKQQYLRIDYLDEWAKKQDIFFCEFDSGMKKVAAHWKSCQASKL